MKELILSNGNFAQVDDEDFDYLASFNWYVINGYAVTKLNYRDTFMHNLVMKVQAGAGVDHRDRNKLNNQKGNLRFATNSQNMQNAVNPRNTSGYRGVFFIKHAGTWQAKIMCNYELHYLGSFKTPEDAAHAYDLKAIKLFGEDAYINFPHERAAIVQFVKERNALASLYAA